jgi:dTDP-4-dehydrorhamnose reductase
VTRPFTAEAGLVLHAAAWTDVDGAESDPEGARLANVAGTRNVAALGAPVVYYSSDYVFDGSKREPYVESDEPRPLSVYGRTKLEGEREVRAGWIVRNEVSVVADQTGSPTYVRHLAEATRELLELPQGVWHVAAEGECTWADFARAIFDEAGLSTGVREITTEELCRPAPRPAYSVLRSEYDGAPRLPHWREGLRACLERL